MPLSTFRATKVPDVFLLFWIVKLLPTGVGEAGADFLGTISIPLAAAIGTGGFFVVLWLRLRAESYHPVRCWVTVLSVALFGTMIADGPHVVLGKRYVVDSAIYLLLLCGLLLRWRRSEGTLCAAIVDRLTFGGNIIETGTDSHRLAHTKSQQPQPRSRKGLGHESETIMAILNQVGIPRIRHSSVPWRLSARKLLIEFSCSTKLFRTAHAAWRRGHEIRS